MLFLIMSSESMYVKVVVCDGMNSFQKESELFLPKHNLDPELSSVMYQSLN